MIWNLIPVENGTKYLLQNSSGLYLTSLPGDRGLIMGNDPVLESTWWTLKKVNYRESGK